jgi:isopenicillin-N epimerase
VTERSTQPTNPLWGDDWADVRALWPLESTVAHLNHGAFGAVPDPVLDEQRSWRERMETNPLRFFTREVGDALVQARAEVAAFLGADPDSIAFVRNATTAVSTVLSSLRLASGDEVVVTDHAHGAVRLAVDRFCREAQARAVQVDLPLEAADDEVEAAVVAAIGPRTRLVLLDQVTSPTARRLPLVSLVPAIRERGATVFVDGAHAPGMLQVELDRLGADYWTGNLHKWCCAPRGTGVLHAATELRSTLRPLVGGWGDLDAFPASFDQIGTDDPTAWLAAPRALRVLGGLGWNRLRAHNVALAVAGQELVAAALDHAGSGLPRDPAVSMQIVPLPAGIAADVGEANALQDRIGEEIAVEVGVMSFRGRGFIRVSAQAYNCPADYERLARDLPALL